ncbi:asparagine synthetase B family protein [Oharaeibacter diazotrophicus]|uniref:asparagine synthase (glutamine-hydrolyzing) n=2 Tax=Oharaeibacter diazotrophicus TaxID=1920512 RepID=A0A4V3CW72_9HYPH|nr:asparagine synthase-related protein [Oharaeibacter diazotrophicus]TDP85258.1 asparagine synthase (glutamine-hydrolysing) [Oharaeibacter diazotrophicus]BBE74229.1 asparagine synthetase [glutamine-hydrolyzing] 3 [Pleomorphomonas sp. SM30]GLS76083.1 asparagine synthetase B [Oharaeibacter diazotrophicus]
MAIAGSCLLDGDWRAPPDIERSLAAMTLGAGSTRSRARTHRVGAAVFGQCDHGLVSARIADGRSILAALDGRLDNRGELLSLLREDGVSPSANDCDIVLSAYARWGEDFPDRLIGDFACAIWDASARSLLLARDAIGARPLFYWHDRDGLFFATEPRGLFAQPAIPKTIDAEWVARSLAAVPQKPGAGFYRGIARVMQGHAMRVAGGSGGGIQSGTGGLLQRRHWRPETLAPIRFARDADYADGLRSMLDTAVRDRIAGHAAVGGHLSAGLDSASVTASAARQLHARGLRLTAFTATPGSEIDPADYPGRLVDEGPLAALTAAAFPNIDHVCVSTLASPLFDAVDRANFAVDEPVWAPINHIWADAISDEARRRGLGVLLIGQAGNVTISYDGNGWLVDLCRQRRWGEAFRQLRALAARGANWPSLINRYLIAQLPTPVRARLRALMGRPELALREMSLIRPEFAARLHVVEEARDLAGDVNNLDRGDTDLRVLMLQTFDLAMFGRAAKRRFGIELLDPTADRRLVEYCLAIPQEQFLRDGEQRALIRRAMSGVLPPAVLNEPRRALQAADWHVAMGAARDEIAREIERLAHSPLASEALDLPRMRRMLADWPTGGWGSRAVRYPYAIGLARGLAVGRFIRQVEGGNA